MYTIKDITNGKCAIVNDGTLEQLNEVLHIAFPLDRGVIGGNNKIYMASTSSPGFWNSSNNTDLPTQSVTDFLQPQLKRGDLVYVSVISTKKALNNKAERIFIAYIEGAKTPYICVNKIDEENFKTNKPFSVNEWKYAVKVPEVKQVEMSIKEIEEKLGITNLKIIK